MRTALAAALALAGSCALGLTGCAAGGSVSSAGPGATEGTRAASAPATVTTSAAPAPSGVATTPRQATSRPTVTRAPSPPGTSPPPVSTSPPSAQPPPSPEPPSPAPSSPAPPSPPSPAPTATSQPAPTPTRTVAPGPKPRRAGRLAFLSDGTAYDLDSLAKNWTPSKGVPWKGIQNIEYQQNWTGRGYPGFLYWNSPWSVAILGANTPQDYHTCHTVAYGGDESASTLSNYPAGAAVARGRAVCLHTPAGNTALLQFESAPGTTITVWITVWKGQ